MLTAEIKGSVDGLQTSLNSVYGNVLTTKIKGSAEGLETSLGPNSDIIEFSYMYKFCIHMNFFLHQTTIIDC